MQDKVVTTIDIGSKLLGASIGKYENGEVEILGNEVVSSKGVEKGEVVNSIECREVIEELLSNVERKYKLEVQDIYVGISNVGLRIAESWGTVNLKEGKVNTLDLKRAINKGKRNISIQSDEEIIDVVINYYKLDGNITTKNVIGWMGSTLELNLTLVIAKQEIINTYKVVFDKTKYFVKGFISNSISCKNIFFTENTSVGTRAIVDCGAGITEIAVFKDGIIKHLDIIKLGGNNITRDLSICGEIAFGEAEKLKKIYSSCYESNLESKETIILKSGSIEMDKGLFFEVCNARVEEIAKYITNTIKKCSHFEGVCSIIIYGEALNYFENINKVFNAYINKKIQIITKEKLGVGSNAKIVSIALLKEGLDREMIFAKEQHSNLHKDTKVNEEIKNDEEVDENGFVRKLKSFLHEIF